MNSLSAIPLQVNKEPIEKRWAPIVDEVCKANTDKEDFCKQLKGVIDGSFFQYMRKYKRELSVSEPHVADVSMTHPYLLIGVCCFSRSFLLLACLIGLPAAPPCHGSVWFVIVQSQSGILAFSAEEDHQGGGPPHGAAGFKEG